MKMGKPSANSGLVTQLIKRKVSKATGAMRLPTREPRLIGTPRQQSLLKGVFSGYN